MSGHINDITFVISDTGEVVILENGEVLSQDDFVLMVTDAKARHKQKLYMGDGHKFSFSDCPVCRKWATAARIWKAVTG